MDFFQISRHGFTSIFYISFWNLFIKFYSTRFAKILLQNNIFVKINFIKAPLSSVSRLLKQSILSLKNAFENTNFTPLKSALSEESFSFLNLVFHLF